LPKLWQWLRRALAKSDFIRVGVCARIKNDLEKDITTIRAVRAMIDPAVKLMVITASR
jgi:hypothetical protein